MTPVAHQPHLLAGVLGVVAGVGLVGDQVGDGRAEHREVGVDGHPAGQAALVVVEPRPRLVGHQLPVDVLALGQTEQLRSVRSRKSSASESMTARSFSGGMAWRLAPGRCSARPADPTRAAPRRGAGEPPRTRSRRDGGAGRRSTARPRRRRRCASPASLRADVCSPTTWPRSQRRRSAPSSGSPAPPSRSAIEPPGVGHQRGRRDRSARPLDPGGDRRRAVVGVDEAVDVATEPQPQLEVAVDRRRRATAAQPGAPAGRRRVSSHADGRGLGVVHLGSGVVEEGVVDAGVHDEGRRPCPGRAARPRAPAASSGVKKPSFSAKWPRTGASSCDQSGWACSHGMSP